MGLFKRGVASLSRLERRLSEILQVTRERGAWNKERDAAAATLTVGPVADLQFPFDPRE